MSAIVLICGCKVRKTGKRLIYKVIEYGKNCKEHGKASPSGISSCGTQECGD